jgi:hypothetical protein
VACVKILCVSGEAEEICENLSEVSGFMARVDPEACCIQHSSSHRYTSMFIFIINKIRRRIRRRRRRRRSCVPY